MPPFNQNPSNESLTPKGEEGQEKLSRRKFLTTLGATAATTLGATLTADHLINKDVSPEEKSRKRRNAICLSLR